MIPKIHRRDDEELGEILRLIQDSFAYLHQRVDPPSSMHHLTISEISENCCSGEVWTIGVPIIACMFLKLKDDALYIGKLAVSENERGRGVGKKMIDHAVGRAVVHNKNFLELYTRIELTENHLAFSKLGFKTITEASHPGYVKPTYLIMRKTVSC